MAAPAATDGRAVQLAYDLAARQHSCQHRELHRVLLLTADRLPSER